jgi:GMP synthase-like glutamine amidotransferase
MGGESVFIATTCLRGHPGWMIPPLSPLASHQDQVVSVPSDARVIASSAFTPYAGLDYGDAISFQFHPEFTRAFAAALIDAKRERYPDLAASAIQSHLKPDDCARVGRWISRFRDSGMSL